MPRHYGGFAYLEEYPNRRGPVFVVAAVPDVIARFKRVFPGHRTIPDTGQLLMSATQANARDLAWFCQRWPLEPLDENSALQLKKMSTAHRVGQELVDRVLAGEIPDITFMRELALTPREYQLVVPALLKARGFLLLGDDLGAGKTLSSSLIFTEPDALPALVVAPDHLVFQWAREELPKYFPWIRTHIVRQGTPYDPETQKRLVHDASNAHVLVTNYHKLYGWGHHLAGRTRTVIFDEGDELRTGQGTRKYDAALQISRAAKYRLLVTATAVHNWADDIWNEVDLLSEGALGTKDEFRLVHGGRQVADPRALGQYLREEGIFLRRTLDEVGIELPPLSQMIYPVETNHKLLQQEMDSILAMARMVVDANVHRQVRWSMSGRLDMKVRQATGVAKAPHVADFVRLLLEGTEKVVLAGHHLEVYDIWRKMFDEWGLDPVFYTGQQTKTQKAESVRRFTRGGSRVFVMGIRTGSGLNGLQTVCHTAVIGEPDWAPARHKQFIGRLKRPGQTKPVSAYFLMSNGGSDPAMADLIELKRQVAEPINDPDMAIVMPSAEEAAHRVQQLAKALLRQHGINPDSAGQTSAPANPAAEQALVDEVDRFYAAAQAADTEDSMALIERQVVEAIQPRPNREALARRLTGDRS